MTILMDLIFRTMEINEMAKIIIQKGYRVVTDRVGFSQKWEIIIEPWDHKLGKKRPGKIKRTGFFFNHNERTFSINGKETEFAKKMKEVQLKLVNHFTNN